MCARTTTVTKPDLAHRKVHIVIDQKEIECVDSVDPKELGNRSAGEVHEGKGAKKEFFTLAKNFTPRELLDFPVATAQKPLENPKAEVMAS